MTDQQNGITEAQFHSHELSSFRKKWPSIIHRLSVPYPWIIWGLILGSTPLFPTCARFVTTSIIPAHTSDVSADIAKHANSSHAHVLYMAHSIFAIKTSIHYFVWCLARHTFFVSGHLLRCAKLHRWWFLQGWRDSNPASKRALSSEIKRHSFERPF